MPLSTLVRRVHPLPEIVVAVVFWALFDTSLCAQAVGEAPRLQPRAELATQALQACSRRPCRVTLTEVWKSPSDRDTWQFERLDRLSLRPGGALLAIDGLALAVYVLDRRDGSLVRKLGSRSGEGPGEFRSLTAAIAGPQGTVWAYDEQLRRFSAFDLVSGALRGVHQIDTRGVLDDALWLADGNIWLSGYRQGVPDQDVHRFDRSLQYITSAGRGRRVRNPAFAHQVKGGTLTQMADGNVLYIQRNPIVLTAFAASGEVVWSLTPSVGDIPDAEDAFEQVSVAGRTGFRFRVDQWVYAIAGFELTPGHLLLVVVDNVLNARRVLVVGRSGQAEAELQLHTLTPLAYDRETGTLYAVDTSAGHHRISALKLEVRPEP